LAEETASQTQASVNDEIEEEKKSDPQNFIQATFNMEELPDSVPRNRVEEALKFRELLQSMDRLVKQNSIWFVIGK
jgi:hypothetical protein